MENLKPRIKLWLNGEGVEGVFGDGKYRLLRDIESTGSLRAASERLGISYRKAWGDLKKAQDALGIILIERQRGGRKGGRSTLTDEGKRWLSAYSRFRRDVEAVMEASFEKFASEVG